jgi:hypothetical protein
VSAQSIQCPAGEIVRPVLSRNKLDVQCRINGHLQPAGEPCCGSYTTCGIWRLHKQIIEANQATKAQRDATVSGPGRHVIESDVAREVVRA